MKLIHKLRKLSETLGIAPGALARLSFTPEQKYERFAVPKRQGKTRTIMKPAPDLMLVQKLIKRHILDSAPQPNDSVMAFVPGRSIVTNARVHSDKAVVAKFDLKDFFPSVSFPRVYKVFRSLNSDETESRTLAFITTSPVQDELSMNGERNLKKSRDFLEKELETAVADIKSAAGQFYLLAEGWTDMVDCWSEASSQWRNFKGHKSALNIIRNSKARRHRGLPQGAPTSPQLANLVCRRLDQRLAGLARRMGFQFTRYADDLTFSSDDRMAKVDRLASAVNEIVRDCGFELNVRKTVVMRSPAARRVTGLTVSGSEPRVPRATMRRIRAMIHQSQRNPDFSSAEQLKGFLSFVWMVNPAQHARLTGELKTPDAKGKKKASAPAAKPRTKKKNS